MKTHGAPPPNTLLSGFRKSEDLPDSAAKGARAASGAASLARGKAAVVPVAIADVCARYGWPQSGWQHKMLTEADLDKDGKISASELDKYLANPTSTISSGRLTALSNMIDSCGPQGRAVDSFDCPQDAEIAKLTDSRGNRDGIVTPAEWAKELARIRNHEEAKGPMWVPHMKAAALRNGLAMLTGEADPLAHGGLSGTQIFHDYETIVMKDGFAVPQLVTYLLTYDDLMQKPAEGWDRTEMTKFPSDPQYPQLPKDLLLSKTGYDRGHHRPAADSPDFDSFAQSFLRTNMSPQTPFLNQEVLATIESAIRQLELSTRGKAVVVTGTMFVDENGKPSANVKRVGSDDDQVAVPTHVFKSVLLELPDGTQRMFAFKLPNQDRLLNDGEYQKFAEAKRNYYKVLDAAKSMPPEKAKKAIARAQLAKAQAFGRVFEECRVPVDKLEKETGIDLFKSIPSASQRRLEAQTHQRAPGIDPEQFPLAAMLFGTSLPPEVKELPPFVPTVAAVGVADVPANPEACPVEIGAVLERFGWKKDSWQAKLLKAADRDGNAEISASELDQYLAEPIKHLTSAQLEWFRDAVGITGCRVNLLQAPWQKLLGKLADTDKDGVVSPEEMQTLVDKLRTNSAGRTAPTWLPDMKTTALRSAVAELTGEPDAMKLEVGEGEQVLQHDYERIVMNTATHTPEVVAYTLTNDDLRQKPKKGWDRTGMDEFPADPGYSGAKKPLDLRNTPYDRGHQRPAADSVDAASLQSSFLRTNAAAQGSQLNQEVASVLEKAIRQIEQAKGWRGTVLSGTMFVDAKGQPLKPEDIQFVGPEGNQVGVPTHFYKAVLFEDDKGKRHVFGFKMPNDLQLLNAEEQKQYAEAKAFFDEAMEKAKTLPDAEAFPLIQEAFMKKARCFERVFREIRCPVDTIEKDLGRDFFAGLPDGETIEGKIEDVLRLNPERYPYAALCFGRPPKK